MTQTISRRHIDDLPELLSVRELASYLGVPVSTLYLWRSRGRGPGGFRMGKQLRYRATDVGAWLEQQADQGQAEAQ